MNDRGEGRDATPFNVYHTRIRSHQTDVNGAMYHGAYLDIFDDARIDTFRTLNYTYADLLAESWMLVIRRVECDYHLPARMDELISVTVTCPHFSRATLTIRFECRRGEDRLATGQNTYAFLNLNGRPMRMPQRLRDLLLSVPELTG